MFEVDARSRARIQFERDTSNDLQTWIVVAGTGFYRFREESLYRQEV